MSVEDILQSLRGHSVTVNLHQYFTEWPFGVHPELERLRKDVDARLER